MKYKILINIILMSTSILYLLMI